MNDQAYFHNLFIQTAIEYLDSIDKEISELMQNPGSKQSVNGIYISAHSIKSQSIAMNYTQTANLALSIEKLFKEMKEEKRNVSKDLLNNITDAVIKLRESIGVIKTENKEPDLSGEIEKLNSVSNTI